MSTLPDSYNAYLFPAANSDLTVDTRKFRSLKPTEILIEVEANGICHSDVITKYGAFPGMTYPRVPGHELVGRVVQVGPEAKRFKIGDRVGRGWPGAHCFSCDPCLHGDFINCPKSPVTGVYTDGGYSEYVYSEWQACALVPEGMSATDAAPLMCAGFTVFNALRQQQVLVPALVAVQGIGGLGHLGIQFAKKMGYTVAAISTGSSKESLAKELGADYYIDTSKVDPAKRLQELGGASMILATGTSSDSVSALIDGLGPRGTLLTIGVDTHSLKVTPIQLISGSKRVQGWATGSPIEAEETLRFAHINGVKSRNELFPLSKATEGFQHMLSGKANFRVVLVPDRFLK